MKARFVIFDFDGTLADTAEGILATERAVLDRMGLPRTDEKQMRSAIGLPMAEFLMEGCNIPQDSIEDAVALYRELFMVYAPDHISLFEGVKDTLSFLGEQGLELAIATSRAGNTLKAILESQSITGAFCDCLTASDACRPKPNPDMVIELMKRNGYLPEDTIVVGDTTYDLLMGRGAGCRVIGVSYGNHDRSMLETASPDGIIDSFSELRGIIEPY